MTSAQPIDTGIEARFAEQRVRLAAMSFPQAFAAATGRPTSSCRTCKGTGFTSPTSSTSITT